MVRRSCIEAVCSCAGSLNGAERGFDVELADGQLRLGFVQASVRPRLVQQLDMRAAFDNAAALENYQPVRFAQRAQAVSNRNRRSAADEVVERRLNVALRFGINR